MSERDTYPAGVPCWVETLQPDAQAAVRFYGPLFVGSNEPGDDPFSTSSRGCAAATSPASARCRTPVATQRRRGGERAQAAGGTVVDGPFDAPPAGRLAVLADPTGALFCVWQAGIREGAELSRSSRCRAT